MIGHDTQGGCVSTPPTDPRRVSFTRRRRVQSVLDGNLPYTPDAADDI